MPSLSLPQLGAVQGAMVFSALYHYEAGRAYEAFLAICNTIRPQDSPEERLPKIIHALEAMPTAVLQQAIGALTGEALRQFLDQCTSGRLAHFPFSQRGALPAYGKAKQQFATARRQAIDEALARLQPDALQLTSQLAQVLEGEARLVQAMSQGKVGGGAVGGGLGALLGALVLGPVGGVIGAGLGAMWGHSRGSGPLVNHFSALLEHLGQVEQCYLAYTSYVVAMSATLHDLLSRLAEHEFGYLSACEQVAPLADADLQAYKNFTLYSTADNGNAFLDSMPWGQFTVREALRAHEDALQRLQISECWEWLLSRADALVACGAENPSEPPHSPKLPRTRSEALVCLGVSEQATPNEIKAAYREKSKQFHPDVLRSKELAPEFIRFGEEQFTRLTAAKDLLLAAER